MGEQSAIHSQVRLNACLKPPHAMSQGLGYCSALIINNCIVMYVDVCKSGL
jgi:hypothetical protein